MNSKSTVLVWIYSALLVTCGLLARFVAPETARVSLIAALVAGPVMAVLGALALAGRRTRGLIILSLVPVAFTFLAQAVQAWVSVDSGRAYRPSANLLITAMLLLSVALLAYLAYTAQFPTGRVETQPSPPAAQLEGSNARTRPGGSRSPTAAVGNGATRPSARTP